MIRGSVRGASVRRWWRKETSVGVPHEAGTILLAGPRWAMASVDAPRGHSLWQGAYSPREEGHGTDGCSPSNFERVAGKHLTRNDRHRADCDLRGGGFRVLVLVRVVLLVVLPHRQHRRCDATSDRDASQARLHAGLGHALVLLVQRVTRRADDGERRAFEYRLED